MGTLLRFLVAATSVLAAPHDAGSDLAHVEHLLYGVSLAEFTRAVSVSDGWFDTTTDWCSAPLLGSTGRSFDFRAPCRRHDFGYRNLKLIEQRYGVDSWNPASRARVDQQFSHDMRAHCATRPWWESSTCHVWAGVFFLAVRAAGGP